MRAPSILFLNTFECTLFSRLSAAVAHDPISPSVCLVAPPPSSLPLVLLSSWPFSSVQLRLFSNTKIFALRLKSYSFTWPTRTLIFWLPSSLISCSPISPSSVDTSRIGSFCLTSPAALALSWLVLSQFRLVLLLCSRLPLCCCPDSAAGPRLLLILAFPALHSMSAGHQGACACSSASQGASAASHAHSNLGQALWSKWITNSAIQGSYDIGWEVQVGLLSLGSLPVGGVRAQPLRTVLAGHPPRTGFFSPSELSAV